MSAQADAPKVFISYSWKPARHQQRVIELAERLMGDGVNVLLDVWDLREGQDKNQFMERMVTDPDVKRVLIICNRDYKDKADNRAGGVGTESLIMSGEIYAKAEQTKFIPLVFETDEEGHAYRPVFVHSRIYLDFTNEEVAEDSYEQLLRNIFDKPARKKPVLGLPPAFLSEAEPTALGTAHRVAAIRNAFVNERRNAPLLVKQYYKTFLESLRKFEPQEDEFTPENFIELTLSRIEQTTPLRADFVQFLEMYLEVAPEIDHEELNSFFNEFASYVYTKAITRFSSTLLPSLQFDYLRFFAYELVLYFVAALLIQERFDILAAFLYEQFVILRQDGDPMALNFHVFNSYNATLNKHQNERFTMNRLSIVGDKIKERAGGGYSFDSLKQADILLHHVSELSGFVPNASSRSYWHPETAAYRTDSMPVFAKMVSARYFDKIKALFNVQTKEELAEKIKVYESDSFSMLWYRSDYFMQREIPQLSRILNIDKIATLK